MFAIHHFSKTYTGICARKHTCTSKVSLFFQIQKLFKVSDIHDTGIVFKSKIMLCYYIVLPLTIDSDCYQWGSF